MTTNPRSLFVVTAALLVAACGSAPTAANNTPALSSSTAAASASPSASAVATTTDPCQVVTQSEASTLAGTTYGTSKEETTSGGGKICWYGAGTLNVFEVFVGTASSAAVAQSQWDTEKSEIVTQLAKQTNVPGLTLTINESDTSLSGADRAAVGTLSETYGGHTFSASALYALKGATFLAIVDLVVDHPAPATSAMEAQGQTALARLP
ncbi:MAG: hypothetical protein WCC30_01070 [Candidatus Dormiibacterota bacterium]